MKSIVTGGAGFLGSHLCDLLLKKGHDVICIDNLVTGNTKNIDHIKSDKFTYLKHDVTKPIYFGDKIDYIFHMASPASPVDYLELPIQTLKVGALGTYNMLGLAKENGARLLIASTSEVYGDPLVNPQPETYWGNVNPIGPRGVYDEAKRYAEAITMAYHRYHGIDTRIVRIFNTYGPRMRANDGRVVPNFINQALRGEDITIYGDGSQTRSFCYVSDLIDGIYRLMMSDFTEPINIGNPAEMSVLEFAEEILGIIDSDSKIIFKELPIDDPKVRRPDISRAKEVLEWEPKVGLKIGLEKTITYFKSIKSNDNK
ncbi:MAG: dTDP-glucose 4,6-dehydratase [Methanolobus sp.]|jgi:dTDP-glucose 4,6-dehydratase|uniref:UDP-glucuronic acid decarboxylase family protein n=1 Tax=Methanolobus sp. TaxID=1874737 RepID=UPI00258C930C|nr:UDP-glucuronic acid decarboxylase family protein [Methanolobus sp.]MDK2831281.1 dTDP-glucose 4,6-dehydratase [Methanolobus sp.]